VVGIEELKSSVGVKDLRRHRERYPGGSLIKAEGSIVGDIESLTLNALSWQARSSDLYLSICLPSNMSCGIPSTPVEFPKGEYCR
jgi:hypothetical protein